VSIALGATLFSASSSRRRQVWRRAA